MERASRTAKTDLQVLPIYAYTEDHVRAHVFFCVLSYYVEWHLRQRLALLLFLDDDRPAARDSRKSPVESAQASTGAKRKADAKLKDDGFSAHGFRTLLDELSSVALNKIRLTGKAVTDQSVATTLTRLQARAFELLEVKPRQTVPIRKTT